jgi:hypothetical protein
MSMTELEKRMIADRRLRNGCLALACTVLLIYAGGFGVLMSLLQ